MKLMFHCDKSIRIGFGWDTIRGLWRHARFSHLLLVLYAFIGVSCVNNPHVTIVSPDGTKTTISTGENLMAEVDEQVSEVEGAGWHLRHMVKRQDATRVPISAIQALGVYGAGKLTAHSNDLTTVTNGKVELGKQDVQKFTEGEKTKRILGTFVPPEPKAP